MTSKERVLETLKSFQRLWAQYYPEKGEPRRKHTTIDINGLQESWNVYMRANKDFHRGVYIPVSDPNFLKKLN